MKRQINKVKVHSILEYQNRLLTVLEIPVYCKELDEYTWDFFRLYDIEEMQIRLMHGTSLEMALNNDRIKIVSE